MGNFISVQKIAAQKIGISYELYLEKIKYEKWCTKCKSWQKREDFNIDNSRGDGLCAKCNFCTRVKIKKCTKGRESYFKGRKHSEETRKIISEKVRAANLPPPMLGKKHSLEARIKISKILRVNGAKGDKCHSYKDGKSVERIGIRFTIEYKRWRFDVFARDNFTCQKCGDKTGSNLNAHHIKPFADFTELRFEINNGITLCEPCHEAEHHKPLSIRNLRKAKKINQC